MRVPRIGDAEEVASKQGEMWGSEMFQTPAGPKTNVERQNSQRVSLFSFLFLFLIFKYQISTWQVLQKEALN